MTDRVAITILVLAGYTTIVTFSYTALLPAIAIGTLGAGATGLGVLTAAGGVGILTMSVFTDRLGSRFGRARVILGAVSSTAFALAILALSPNLVISAVACAGAAGLLMAFISTSSLVLQAWSPPAIKGRSVSILSIVFWGALPVGAVLIGAASDRVGARSALLVCAALSLLSLPAVALTRRDFIGVDVDASGRPVP